MFFCFKKFPLNFNQNFESFYHLVVGARLLLAGVGVVNVSTNKSLDFHDITFSLLLSVFKV